LVACGHLGGTLALPKPGGNMVSLHGDAPDRVTRRLLG
jgi:hypothetical protein